MTETIGREELSERAVEAGWHRRDEGRTDYYSRSPVRIHVIWGPEAISGGALYHDDNLMTYTRDPDTIMGWLKR